MKPPIIHIKRESSWAYITKAGPFGADDYLIKVRMFGLAKTKFNLIRVRKPRAA